MGRVRLQRHHPYEQGAYGLVGGVAEGFYVAVELSDAERKELLQLCRQRLDAFREQRGGYLTCRSCGRLLASKNN